MPYHRVLLLFPERGRTVLKLDFVSSQHPVILERYQG